MRRLVLGAVGLLVVALLATSSSSSGNRVSIPGTSTTTSTASPQVSPSDQVAKPEVSVLESSTTTSTTTEGTVGAPAVDHSSDHASGRELGTFSVTCYSLRGTTASGAPAGPGSIAVDPAVIPLGTELEVDGYGRGVAADTGGAIRGRRLDVWKSSTSECLKWGRRSVSVRVLDA